MVSVTNFRIVRFFFLLNQSLPENRFCSMPDINSKMALSTIGGTHFLKRE